MAEVKKRNQYEFDKKKYDHVHLQLTKGKKEVVQAAAVRQGESLNGFVTTAIDERISRLEGTSAATGGDDQEG